ncbi:TBC1 domain family member 15 isoform X3 [Gouania willdenowi]|uniref:TBC1 domain family member 15 isoform X3 n=1 Tax=Gouania willdenowi TaxID=441366 RepID=UPI0010548A0D|nr:TBC1 domain family member 15 isoform X3 [Gouania willdenowi]
MVTSLSSMAAEPELKVIFEHDGVFLHPTSDDDEEDDEDEGVDRDLLVSGILRILQRVKDSEVVVEFRPQEDTVDPSNMLCAGKDSSSVVQWSQGSEEVAVSQLETQHSYETEWDMLNAVTFRKRQTVSTDGAPSMERNCCFFSINVCDLQSITVKDEGWTFLILTLKDSSSLPPLHFHQGGSRTFLETLQRFTLLTQSEGDESCLVVSAPNKALSQSFENLLDDHNYGLKLRRDPYVTTFGGFSKVTNYIMGTLRGSEETQRPPLQDENRAELLCDVIPGLEINRQEEPGFEVITRVDLGERPQVTRSDPLTSEEWSQQQDAEGRMMDSTRLRHAIFRGGLSHAVRKEAWKFLLGFFQWDSTLEDRKLLQRDKTDEYFRMKLQWKSVSEEQERRNSRLRDFKSLIEKDVNRTDRTNHFYEGVDNPGLVLLHDILMTYVMYDFDLGYVQGMSDLLSPILLVMENEADAFWCFVCFMDHMHQNFEEKMQGMKTQLKQLSMLLRLLDLKFLNYLESQDSGVLYFCFRWLLLRFKRELCFQDVLRLWEVMWTGLPCENFHLLLCCAVLDSEKQTIMEKQYGFNEILKHINELSMKLDVEEILQKAESICLQIQSCKDRPSPVSVILGLDSADADWSNVSSSHRPTTSTNGHLNDSSSGQSPQRS